MIPADFQHPANREYTIECIWWLDHYEEAAGWHSWKKAPSDHCECVSVGFVLDEDEQCVYLMRSYNKGERSGAEAILKDAITHREAIGAVRLDEHAIDDPPEEEEEGEETAESDEPPEKRVPRDVPKSVPEYFRALQHFQFGDSE